ncbi:MAG TPA: hypothetical protein VIS48_10790 [Candidatus Kryptonia bacterium]
MQKLGNVMQAVRGALYNSYVIASPDEVGTWRSHSYYRNGGIAVLANTCLSRGIEVSKAFNEQSAKQSRNEIKQSSRRTRHKRELGKEKERDSTALRNS